MFPHELQRNPYKIVSVLSVLFYLITLRNFIIEFQILFLYPSIIKVIFVNEILYLKTL